MDGALALNGPSDLRKKTGGQAERIYGLAYAVAAIAFTAAATWQLLSPLRLNGPGADIWRHLAAIAAIIDDPTSPANPFVATDDPSRLFGPYWVAVGAVAKAVGATALQAYIAAGIGNLLLWTAAVLVFGRAFFGSSKGALFLLLTLTLGWIAPPSFTGYHSPLGIITGAANPAFLLQSLTLILWAWTIQLLGNGKRAIAILFITGIAVATHPLGAAVAIAGCGAFALFTEAPRGRQARLGAAVLGGAILALLWPYYSVIALFSSVGRSDWTTSADFYAPIWLFQSLIPGLFGLAGLLNRRALPLATLLGLCAIGFAFGATPWFAAGHRLLPYVALILHIGLAQLVLDGWRSPRLRLPIMATAVMLAAAQIWWTARIVGNLRTDLARDGSQLDAARGLAGFIPPGAGIAAYETAAFPITAAGRRVLSTSFVEPMGPDMDARHADSLALFDPAMTAGERAAIASRRGVHFLIVDVRTVRAETLQMLRAEARSSHRAGNLILFRIASDRDDQRR